MGTEAPRSPLPASKQGGLFDDSQPSPRQVAGGESPRSLLTARQGGLLDNVQPSVRSSGGPISSRQSANYTPSASLYRPPSSSRARPPSAGPVRPPVVVASLRPPSAARARPAVPGPGDGVVAVEVTRLQNALRAKEREADEVAKELTTLKSGIAVKERSLQQKSMDAEVLKDRALQAEGHLATTNKDLLTIKVEKRKLESTVAEQARQLEKMQQQLTSLQSKNPGIGMHVATLQAEARSAKNDFAQAQEDNRSLDNIIRNKDKELARMGKRVAEVDALDLANLELENVVRSLQTSLDEAAAGLRTLTMVNRACQADMAKLQRELEGCRIALAASQEALANSNGTLKATEARCVELDVEVQVLRDDLARTSAVASRVAMAEVKGGSHWEGTVPAIQHLEEVKHLTGEVTRLRDRIALLERDVAVAHEIKEKFKREAQGMPPTSSTSRRTSNSHMTPGGHKPMRASYGGAASPNPYQDSTPSRPPAYDQESLLESMRARMGRASVDGPLAASAAATPLPLPEPETLADDTEPDAAEKALMVTA